MCPRCKGFVYTEKDVAEGYWIEITHCVNCGWYQCPEQNLYISVANRIDHYRKRKKTWRRWDQKSKSKSMEAY